MGKGKKSDPTKNVKALNKSGIKAVKAEMKLRAAHELEMREMQKRLAQGESERIDALRAADINNVAISVQQAVGKAAVLEVQLTRLQEGISVRIDGLSARTSALEVTQGAGDGRSRGYGASWQVAVVIIMAVLTGAGTIWNMTRPAPVAVYAKP